jgi:hypothetical protein
VTVTNAVSLNMLPPEVQSGGIIFRRLGLFEAQRLADTIVSAIGHAASAAGPRRGFEGKR